MITLRFGYYVDDNTNVFVYKKTALGDHYFELLSDSISIMKVICVILLAICGTISTGRKSVKIEPRIIGGHTASVGQFPYQVSLQTIFHRRHFCAASIISNRFLLTAGHCTGGREACDFIAVVGTVHREFDGFIHEIQKIIRHEEFNLTLFNNDIALLYTVDEIIFTLEIQPIIHFCQSKMMTAIL